MWEEIIKYVGPAIGAIVALIVMALINSNKKKEIELKQAEIDADIADLRAKVRLMAPYEVAERLNNILSTIRKPKG